MRETTGSRRPGFTLIELGVVIAIIGILISLILVAGAEGVRRAEERQTQALIIKLETALSERLDALLNTTAPINQTHRYLAAITYTGGGYQQPINNSFERRAQVIAQFDYMKAELPDVFYVNYDFVNNKPINGDSGYPLNFAMPPYPLNAPTSRDAYALPLGNRQPGLPYTQVNAGLGDPTPGFDVGTGYNDLPSGLPYTPQGLIVAQDSGIYGASFTAAASLYKNLYESAFAKLGQPAGLTPKFGYDGVDNDRDGYVDNIDEVAYTSTSATVNQALNTQFKNQVTSQLGSHDHKTARSEMLYALLVEGQGPLGSAFNASDFTSRDVADTDGDGMPEFIDAWGQPLQFYRWPIYYGAATLQASPSDSQKGFAQYSYQDRRQLDPLDPNQLLTSVAWWGSSNGTFASMAAPATVPTGFVTGTGVNPSAQAYAFMSYFHIIIDPVTPASPPPTPRNITTWDRTGLSRRRSYYSKFLVLSGGPDEEIGVFRIGKNYQSDIDSTYSPAVNFSTTDPVVNAQLLNWGESQAAQVEFTGRLGTFHEDPSAVLSSPTSLYLQTIAGLDDISNHALSAPGTGAK